MTDPEAEQQPQAPVDPSPFSGEKARTLTKLNVYSFTVYRKSQIAAGNQMGERVYALGTDLEAARVMLLQNLDPDDVTNVSSGVVQVEGAYLSQPETPPVGEAEKSHSGRVIEGSTHSGISAGTSKVTPKKS